MVDRDQEICKAADRLQISGYNRIPLDRDQIVSFIAKLDGLRQKSVQDLDVLKVGNEN